MSKKKKIRDNSLWQKTKQLRSAIDLGDLNTVREIIISSPILIKESTGMLELCRAIETKNIDMVRLLIELGAEVDDIDKILYDDQIPLALACSQGNLEMARILIDAGAIINTDRKDPEFLNPFMCAVGSGNFDLVKLLVDRGADVDVMRDAGSNALSIAIYCQYSEIVEYLTPLTSTKIKAEML